MNKILKSNYSSKDHNVKNKNNSADSDEDK